MKIKVNVPLLGRIPGEVLNPGDRNYEEFKRWTEAGDRHGGAVIGIFIEESEPLPDTSGESGKKSNEGEDGSLEGEGSPDASGDEETAGETSGGTETEGKKRGYRRK